MALNYQQPRDPGEAVRARWSRGLEGIFDAYQASKQNAQGQARLDKQDALAAEARANAERDRQATGLLQYGFDPRQVTPQVLAQASGPIPQGPTLPGQDTPENPLAGAVRAFLDKKKSALALGAQGQQAGIDLTRAKTTNELAEAKRRGEEAGTAGAARGLKAEGELRGELQVLSKPFVQVRDSMGRIEAAAKNPSAAGDLALIFNYMKVLDPGSTVREGEFATAQNSAGLPERIRAKYNQVINGERLADDQRADFVSRARDLYQSQASIQKQQEEQYRGLAGRMGANPANVILNQGLPQQAQQAQTPEQIRADFQAGKITREQARASIAALRGGNRGR